MKNKFIRDILIKKIPRKYKEYNLLINDNEIEKMRIHWHPSKFKTTRILLKLKTPIYNQGYLFRNKKGFNTLLFLQNYDVIATNKDGQVIELFPDCKIGYTSKYFENGFNIYFFTVGTIKFYQINKKDVFTLRGDTTKLVSSFI